MRRVPARSIQLLLLLLTLFSASLQANDLLMVRSQLPFSHAEAVLKAEIEARGYVISQAESVDIDLVAMGVSDSAYRVIQYGKPDEVKMLTARHPELIPFLPLQIVMFAEWSETLFVTFSPAFYARIAPQGELADLYARWGQDLGEILNTMRNRGK